MKKNIIKDLVHKLGIGIMISFFCITSGHAQESAVSGGGDGSGAGGTVAYSVGQVLYTTNNGSNGSVAQGVQQTYKIAIVSTFSGAEGHVGVSVSPNPTTDLITLKVDNFTDGQLTYQLYDITGRMIESYQLTSEQANIDMRKLCASTYFLTVAQDKNEVGRFRIVKN